MWTTSMLGTLLVAAPLSCFSATTHHVQTLSDARGALLTPTAVPRSYWAAVARYEDNFFGAWAFESEDEANRAAVGNCEKRYGKGNCIYTSFSGSECWALARGAPDRGGWGQGLGVTIDEAFHAAMRQCIEEVERCMKSFTFCADGSNLFNDR